MTNPDFPMESRITGKRAARQPSPEQLLASFMRDTLTDLIREQVVHRLGSPAGLLEVRVFPLWADRYRVNVLVGKDVTSCMVADSFFLVTDGDGQILSSSPAIARLY